MDKSYKRGFYRSMIIAKQKIAEKKDRRAGEVWLEVKDILEMGYFSSYKKAGQLSSLILNGYSDEYISKHFGIEEPTVRVTKRKLSIELYKLFGEDFFDLLLNYNENSREISKRMYIAKNLNKSAVDLIPEEVLTLVNGSLLGKEPKATFDMKDCSKELSFLLSHSKLKLREEVQRLDKEKLSYLLNMLDGKNGTSSDRFDLLYLFKTKEGNLDEETDL